jgi:hypothetical protein
MLTMIRDLDLKMLEKLDDKQLMKFRLVNRAANRLYENDTFWRNRFMKRFGKLYKKCSEKTWKDFYWLVVKTFAKSVYNMNNHEDSDISTIIASVDKRGKEYRIHDNGDSPFKLLINDNVLIYKIGYEYSEDEEWDSDEDLDEIKGYSKYPSFILLNPKKTFVGESHFDDITENSGMHGSYFDGNSILVNAESNNYVYIGSEIYKFTSIVPIIEYKSPVGRNDIPYPYATDKNGNIYLFLEKVAILNGKYEMNAENPYVYYYHDKKRENLHVE